MDRENPDFWGKRNMQPQDPSDYDNLDNDKPFKADIGNLSEDELKKYANNSCKRCNSTGREGFIGGIAIVCRCVKKKLFQKMLEDRYK